MKEKIAKFSLKLFYASLVSFVFGRCGIVRILWIAQEARLNNINFHRDHFSYFSDFPQFTKRKEDTHKIFQLAIVVMMVKAVSRKQKLVVPKNYVTKMLKLIFPWTLISQTFSLKISNRFF